MFEKELLGVTGAMAWGGGGEALGPVMAFTARLIVTVVMYVRLLLQECEFHKGRGFVY